MANEDKINVLSSSKSEEKKSQKYLTKMLKKLHEK